MTGFEVAGVALALLPLLISAAENYENCLAPFSRFRKFPKEAEKFIKLFKTQHAIFHNRIRIMLAEIVDHDSATSMLDDPEHCSWRNSDLDQQLADVLDKSKAACVATIELISERLSDMKSECQHLAATAGHNDKEPKGSNEKNLTTKCRLATKVRFSFSKSRLSQDIDALRSLNYDLETLASQSMMLETRERRTTKKASKEIEDEIQKCVVVGKASRKVYEALGQACTKHMEHLAHTCAEVGYTVSNIGCSPQVKFRMALAGSTKQKDPILFMIDVTLEDSIAGNQEGTSEGFILDPEGVEHTLKRRLQQSPDCAKRKVKKRVQFESSVNYPAPERPLLTIANPFSLHGRLNRDFCDHLRRCRSNLIQPNTCVGTLETIKGCKNSIFLPTLNSCIQNQQAISLGQLMASLSQQKNKRVVQLHERLNLAKVLTIAVLQYQSTPWLPISWKSNDIVFFGDDAESMLQQQSALTAPHFNARIKGTGDASREGLTQTNCALGARNPLLYSLGIVLLEIAYWTGWDCLKQPRKGERDLYQARRLLKSGCSDMGPKYNMIVEKLIECDFGCGDDLSAAPLQTALYRDVVHPLKELESKMKALQIGS